MLTADDPCRAATDPAAWAGDCCHTTGIWRVRPGLPVPEEAWVATMLHAMKARLIALLLSQRPLPPSRVLRGHTSPKMANGFWLSRSAVRGDTLPASAATDPGTWRRHLMWRITVHRLRALGARAAPVDSWQAGALHVVQHAPWLRGGGKPYSL